MKIFSFPRWFSGIGNEALLLGKDPDVHAARTLNEFIHGITQQPGTNSRALAVSDKQLGNPSGPRKIQDGINGVIAFQDLDRSSRCARKLQAFLQSLPVPF